MKSRLAFKSWSNFLVILKNLYLILVVSSWILILGSLGKMGCPLKVTFWSCFLNNTQANTLFIRVTLWRSNEPVPISHLQLKCNIQLIEYMATVNYFVTANWYSLGSCCWGPINIILPYRFLFLQWILFCWHIYIVSCINEYDFFLIYLFILNFAESALLYKCQGW